MPIDFLPMHVFDQEHIRSFAMRSAFFALPGFQLAYGFAWLSWRAIELPFLRLKRYF